MAGTKIAIVRGLNDNLGKPIGDMPIVNPLTKTQGEFMLELVKQRLAVYNDVLPQKSKLWRKGMAMIDNTLYNKNGAGLHGFTPYFGSIENELQFVAKATKEAAKRTNYATKQAYIGKQDIRRGYDFRLDALNGIGANVFDTYEGLKDAGCVIVHQRYNPVLGHYENYEVIDNACFKLVELLQELNNNLPKSSHQAIYNFISDPNAAKWSSVAKIKAVQHSQVIGEVSRVATISFDLLTTWQKNCIIWRNAERGAAGIITPQDVIQKLVEDPNFDIVKFYNENKDNTAAIGEPITLTVALIWAIIGAIVAITGLIQVCKGKEPTAFSSLAGLATAQFAASGTDHKTSTTTGGGENDTKTQAQKDCEAKTGYTWNDTLKTCEKDDVPPQNNGFNLVEWVKENPLTAGLIGVGAGLALTAK